MGTNPEHFEELRRRIQQAVENTERVIRALRQVKEERGERVPATPQEQPSAEEET